MPSISSLVAIALPAVVGNGSPRSTAAGQPAAGASASRISSARAADAAGSASGAPISGSQFRS
jgi:hypothetical protein